MISKHLDKFWSQAAKAGISPEAGVLGSMIIDRDVVPKVKAIVEPDYFYSQENRIIYKVLLSLQAAGNPTDAICLRDELQKRGKLDEIGGVDYIRKVMESVPSSANAEYYARIVKEHWRDRVLAGKIECMQGVLNEPLDVNEKIEKVQQLTMSLPMEKQQSEFHTFRDNIEKTAEEIGQDDSYIATGFRGIDNFIDGFRPGELVIIAARPSVGKSSISLQIALNAAKREMTVLYVSLEMGTKLLEERAIGIIGDLNIRALKRYPQTDEIYQRARDAAKILRNYTFIIHEKLNKLNSLIAFVIEQNQRQKLDIVFIDYLQLMSAGSKLESRVLEISEISRRLKNMAMGLNIPVVVLSQLNREVESRTGHRPRLSDLRDSGAIEQDADVVLLLHRDDYYRQIENSSVELDGVAEVLVAKNRTGPTGLARLVFLPEFCKFGDIYEGTVNG